MYDKSIINEANTNHKNGEKSKDSITSIALAQLGNTWIFQFIGINNIDIVTHKIAHIREWELDAGIPKYHVKKFQIIADKSKDITTIIPKEVDW